MDEPGFLTIYRTALSTDDYKELGDWVDREHGFHWSDEPPVGVLPVPDLIFSSLLELLSRPGFLAAEDSHEVVHFFETHWDILTAEHRERLRPALRQAYPEFHDWMSRFLVSILFGERYRDEEALEDLLAFMNLERPDLRELVPTGLDNIARQTARPDLAARALARLEEARTDPDPRVRNEVDESFWRIEAWQGDRAEDEEQAALIGPITSEKRWDEAVFSRVLEVATGRESYLVLAEWVEQECQASFFLQPSTHRRAPISELIFSGILDLLERPGFLEARHARRVLDFFGGDCSNLTPEQLKRLRKALRKALPEFQTLGSRTAAAKLLADRFRDELTLKDLLTLMKDEDPDIREAIPEALGSLARQDARPDIAATAAAALEEARTDPDPEVREEVELALDCVRSHRDVIARLEAEHPREN